MLVKRLPSMPCPSERIEVAYVFDLLLKFFHFYFYFYLWVFSLFSVRFIQYELLAFKSVTCESALQFTQLDFQWHTQKKKGDFINWLLSSLLFTGHPRHSLYFKTQKWKRKTEQKKGNAANNCANRTGWNPLDILPKIALNSCTVWVDDLGTLISNI